MSGAERVVLVWSAALAWLAKGLASLRAGLPASPRAALLAEVTLVVGLTLAGALLRTIALQDIPPGLAGDESWTGVEARRILDQGPIGVWSPSALGQPAGHLYWTAFLFLFLPESIWTIRFALAIIAIFTIPVFYLMARNLYGWRVAAIGTFFLTFSYWHIHYSRTSFGLNLTPLFLGLSLLFLAKGLTSGKGWAFAASGVSLALGAYVYKGYMFAVLPFAPLWLFLSVTHRPFLSSLRGLAIFVVTAVITAAPLLDFALTEPQDIAGYAAWTSIFDRPEFKETTNLLDKGDFFARQLLRGMSIYFRPQVVDTTDGFLNIPILESFQMVLFSLGLAISLWRWRCWQYFIVPLGVAAGVLVVAITTPDFGEHRRGFGSLPLVYAAIGIGGAVILRAIAVAVQVVRPRPYWLYAPLGLLAVFSAYTGVDNYFRRVPDDPGVKFAFTYELVRAASYLESLNETPYVYFYSGRWSWGYEVLLFLIPDIPGENRSPEFTGELNIEVEPEEKPILFLMVGGYDNLIDELRRRYPNGRYFEEREGDRFIFGAYHLAPPQAGAGNY